MAQLWHKVVVDGLARYRASASRAYVSYNIAKDSWSSKMLLGNVPVEQLAKAPKRIKVKGSAWGVQVERSYMEGERPVTHCFAHKGRIARFSWDKFVAAGNKGGASYEDQQNPAYCEPANADYVWFDNYTRTELSRADSLKTLAYYDQRIKDGEVMDGAEGVCIVELR